jgi:hypothetical protein
VRQIERHRRRRALDLISMRGMTAWHENGGVGSQAEGERLKQEPVG